MNLKQRKRLTALSLAVTMGAISLPGCSSGFQYEWQDKGIVVVTGDMSFNELKTTKLVHITNEIAQLDKYYLVSEDRVYIGRGGHMYTNYIDIETGKTVYMDAISESYEKVCSDYKNFEMEVLLDGGVDYLYKYDMVYDEYTFDDVVTLKECLLNDDTLFKTMQSHKILSRKKYNYIM